MERQHQGKKAIRGKRNMPTIGKRQVEIIAVFGELFDHVRRKGRIRDQRRQHRRKVAPFAVDFDAERQFEPIDAATLELRIEGAGSDGQPIGEIIIDANFKTFGPQVNGARVEKVEPAAS